jgi:bifunctional enzyme CysN/CysC
MESQEAAGLFLMSDHQNDEDLRHRCLIAEDIDAYLESTSTRPCCASSPAAVDDGKSTLIGRLLYDSEDDLRGPAGRAAKPIRKKVGTQGQEIDFALLVDGLAAEREQGITIDVAYRFFATEKRKFIVADCPGHEQYTRNMVTGASTADLAVILIDARKGVLTSRPGATATCAT